MNISSVYTKEEIQRMIFVSSCIESTARKLKCSTSDIYKRMKKVNLIDGYILKHYNTIHSESRETITEDIIGCLEEWERKEVA